MNDTQSALQKAFLDASIGKVAIVDDGYDNPTTSELEEQRWLAFTTATDEAEDRGPHARLLESLQTVPSFADLRQATLNEIWAHYRGCNEQIADGDPIGDALKDLFAGYGGRKLAKLRQLRHVEAAVKRGLGRDAETLPSGTAAAALSSYDMVFLDFFLGEETDRETGDPSGSMMDKARAAACKLVREVTKEVSPKTPLFVLISSLASVDITPSFRDEAELLASKFRFLSKGEIEADPARADYIVAGLVRQRSAADAVETFQADWRQAVDKALIDAMASIRRLDVSEFSYLHNYRLSEDKTSLAGYLAWLYNSYLGSLAEKRLAFLDETALKPLMVDGVPPSAIRPLSDIPRIYSDVTISGEVDPAAAKVWTGDIFLRRALVEPARPAAGDTQPALSNVTTDGTAAATPIAKAESRKEVLPDAMVVVTPVCDLVVGREKVRTILLVAGKVRTLGVPKEPGSNLVVIDRKDRSPVDPPPQYQIKWNEKWPMSFDLKSFDGTGIEGTDYLRIGRLRDLYAAEVAHKVTADISRVGVPIAPVYAFNLAVRVLARNSKRKTIRLADFPASDGSAWEFYASMSKSKREMAFSEDFIWRLRKAAEENWNDDGGVRDDLLGDLELLRPLTVPFANTKRTPTGQDKFLVTRVEDHPAKDDISGDVFLVLQCAGAMGQAEG